MFPIIGGRKVEQLEGNIKALDITLSPAQMEALEGVLPFEKGFPSSFIVSANNSIPQGSMSHVPQGDGTHQTWMEALSGTTDKWPVPAPLNP